MGSLGMEGGREGEEEGSEREFAKVLLKANFMKKGVLCCCFFLWYSKTVFVLN